MINPVPIRDRFVSLSPHLDERERRLLAATEARAAGYGGIAAVARATGGDVTVALDLQRHAPAGEGTYRHGTQNQPHRGWRTAQRPEIQPSGQPQDPGRRPKSGP